MINNVVKLVPLQKHKSHGCVETLKNMLSLAKRGEITGVAVAAVAAVDRAGYTHTAFEGGENVALLIGSVERVKYRLLTYQDGV